MVGQGFPEWQPTVLLLCHTKATGHVTIQDICYFHVSLDTEYLFFGIVIIVLKFLYQIMAKNESHCVILDFGI